MKPINSILQILFIFSLSVESIFGCSCYKPTPPPCYAYGKSEAVFIGSIKELVVLGEESLFNKVEIDVEKNFRGVDRKTISSESAHSDSACHRIFKKGKKYLFYGNISRDGMEYSDLGICWRTQIYENSLKDFDFLNLVNNSKPVYWVWGTFTKGWGESPQKGIKAEVFDGKKKITAFSDIDGLIKIPVSKAGKYVVKVYLPQNTTPDFSPWMMEEKIFPEIKLKLKKGREFFTMVYLVEVKPNQCGWFDVQMSSNINNKE